MVSVLAVSACCETVVVLAPWCALLSSLTFLGPALDLHRASREVRQLLRENGNRKGEAFQKRSYMQYTPPRTGKYATTVDRHVQEDVVIIRKRQAILNNACWSWCPPAVAVKQLQVLKTTTLLAEALQDRQAVTAQRQIDSQSKERTRIIISMACA